MKDMKSHVWYRRGFSYLSCLPPRSHAALIKTSSLARQYEIKEVPCYLVGAGPNRMERSLATDHGNHGPTFPLTELVECVVALALSTGITGTQHPVLKHSPNFGVGKGVDGA